MLNIYSYFFCRKAKVDIGTGDIAVVAKQLAQNMEDMDIDEQEGVDDDGDDVEDMPIFTPELAMLKAKEKGEVYVDDQPEDGGDDDMDVDGDSDDSDGGKKQKEQKMDEFSDSEEEKEDYTIRKTDSLIVTATAENDHSNLEVYIYEHEKANLYVHHEIILGAYPLSLEWLPQWMGQKSNMIAVSTFLPEIEIWNLDSEAGDPIAVLGSVEKSEEAKNQALGKKSKNQQSNLVFSEVTHTDAVLSISVNPFQSEYLASASADHTVRIWDLDELEIKANY